MSQDDLVPDSAIISRMTTIHSALNDISELIATRKHLPQDMHVLAEGLGDFISETEAAAQPDDEINAKYRSRMRGTGFPTYSGVWFYPLDPQVKEIRHIDIVMGLIHECRYNGQIDRFYSVAEHSIKVAAIVEHLVQEEVRQGNLPADIVPLAALHALMHDAHEALTSDVVRPIKGILMTAFGEPWSRVEDRIQDVILEAYGIPPVPAEVASFIKQADNWMLYCEASVIKKNTDCTEWPGITIPTDVEVLNIGRVRVKEPKQVRELFDGEVRRLVRLVGGHLPADEALEQVARTSAPVTSAPVVTPPAVTVAEAAAVVGVPGERPNDPPPPSNQEQYLPNLSRPARGDDVSQGSWQSAVKSSQVDIPSKLADEPEFKGE